MDAVKLIVVLVLCVEAVMMAKVHRPSYIDCLDSHECGHSRCCVLGQHRYSIPTCTEMGEVGSSCRPNNEPGNYQIGYPDGYSAIVRNGYLNLCDCQRGLECSRITGTCQHRHH
ncbi:hypothetical protein L9F63_009450 [Diploptera punctata]|uniref:Prokineticin domain-containing protein n=1 Tax=Diploptera punctata TaxID=6984 RepID=A0AAD8AJM2_DIPPU|nr:hypothetical protein L9F63_009450 [Diploptera punctata]